MWRNPNITGPLWRLIMSHNVLHLAQLTHCNIKLYEFINSFYALSKMKNAKFRYTLVFEVEYTIGIYE